MAIERTNLFDSASVENTYNNLYNYLLENAVPKYFDSVIKNEDNSYIICTVNGNAFLELPITMGKIKAVLTNNVVFEGATVGGTYGCAFKLKHGIFLGSYQAASAKYFPPLLSICKDNENNTAVILSANYFVNTNNNDNRIMSFNANTANKNYPVLIVRGSELENITGKTVLCPIVVGDTDNYTPNAFIMPYAQNRSDGVLCIDGVNYYSNGIWCVKDE